MRLQTFLLLSFVYLLTVWVSILTKDYIVGVYIVGECQSKNYQSHNQCHQSDLLIVSHLVSFHTLIRD